MFWPPRVNEPAVQFGNNRLLCGGLATVAGRRGARSTRVHAPERGVFMISGTPVLFRGTKYSHHVPLITQTGRVGGRESRG
ncbi:MAG: hypothetical protein QOC75_5350 [Pseudonocardiales bacterium]|nr:hypothetical protein [Pseudonocardiales bacterium]